MTSAQKVALAISILGFLAGAGSQLTDILSPLGTYAPLIVKEIVSLAGFAVGIMGIIQTNLTGQAAQIKNVAAMPGVEKIVTNQRANATLTAIADDDAQPKVQPL